MGGKMWTEGETKILVDTYSRAPIEEIQSTLPNRTYMAIATMAKRFRVNRPQHHSTKVLTDYEKGFVEGVLDSEGTIALYRNHNKCWVSERGFKWVPYATVTNTNFRFLEKVKEICGGGRLYFKARKNVLRNQKAQYIYEMNRGVIKCILPQINLVIKEKQRQLLIEALELIIHGGNSSERIRQVQRYNDKRLQEIYEKMKALNKRGLEIIPE